MNSLTSYIEAAAVAALAGTGTFVHDSPELATLVLNSAMLPAIIYGESVLEMANTQSRGITATVTIYFGAAVPGAGDDYALDSKTVAAMQLLCNRFIAILDDPMALTKVESQKYVPFHKAYEAMLSGTGCQFRLTVPATPLLVRCLPGAAPVITNMAVAGA